MRELGIGKKQVLGVVDQELSSRQGRFSHVACTGHALLHERCLDVLLPRAQLRFNLQLDGFSQWAFSERGGVCTAEIPSYAQKGSSFF